METKYDVVKYNPEYKDQVIELQKHLWSSNKVVNAAYFEWKYERNPYVDTPHIYLVLYEGQVVGMRGMFGARWQIGNPRKTFLGLCAGDLVIAPEHRNRGLFTKIMINTLKDLADKNYHYIFSLSSGPVTRLSSLATGWRSIGNLEAFGWKPRHRNISRRLRKYMTELSLPPLAKAHDPFYFLDKNTLRRQGRISPHVSIAKTPRPEVMAELVERIGYDGRIRHVRDKEYFSWRFNNPLSSYRFLFWEDSRLEGYLILQTKFNDDTLRVSIVDWEAANPRVQSELIEAVLRLEKFEAMIIWTATLPDAVKVLLGKNGFRVLGEAKS